MIGKYGINKVNKAFGEKTQALCAFKIVFNFETNSDFLSYLNNKEIEIS